MKENCYVGIDLGSSAIKVVVIDENRKILSRILHLTSLTLEKDIEIVTQKIQEAIGENYQCSYTVSTGYGRKRVPFAQVNKPEIICHAKGVHYHFPLQCTVIDIGGQDNKVIQVDEKGVVTHFKMNSKCAAGTGAFLEEIANKAKLSLSELHGLAKQSNESVPVNSYCTVFAMTEILKKIVEGERLEDIARGVYLSIADRIQELYRHSKDPVVLTGGVIEHNSILHQILNEKLEHEILHPERPQFTGALGAAFWASELQQKQ